MFFLRVFFLIAVFNSLTFGAIINESILKIHATLLPKITFMDNDFDHKVQNQEISILIYYNENDYSSALALKDAIAKKYKDGIKGYTITSTLQKYNTNKTPHATIIYLFPSTSKNITTLTKYATQKKQLTFAYSKDDLALGVLFALTIGSDVKPIVNLDIMKESGINLRPTLLKIAKRYQDDPSAQ